MEGYERMANYQKAGTFAARIARIAMIMYGAWTLLGVAAFLVNVSLPGESPFVFWFSPLISIAVGVVLFKNSARVGEFLGADLD